MWVLSTVLLVEMNMNNNSQMDFSLSQSMTPAWLSLGQKGSENFPKFFSTSFPFSQVQMSSRWYSHALRNSQDFWESHQTSLLGMWPSPGSMASPESHSTSLGSSFFGSETSGERGSPFYPPFPEHRGQPWSTLCTHAVLGESPHLCQAAVTSQEDEEI